MGYWCGSGGFIGRPFPRQLSGSGCGVPAGGAVQCIIPDGLIPGCEPGADPGFDIVDPAVDLPVIAPPEERAALHCSPVRPDPVLDPYDGWQVPLRDFCCGAPPAGTQPHGNVLQDIFPATGQPGDEILKYSPLPPPPFLAASAALAALLVSRTDLPVNIVSPLFFKPAADGHTVHAGAAHGFSPHL